MRYERYVPPCCTGWNVGETEARRAIMPDITGADRSDSFRPEKILEDPQREISSGTVARPRSATRDDQTISRSENDVCTSILLSSASSSGMWLIR